MSSLVVVEFPWGRDKDPRVPLGHASLIAVLQSMNIEYTSIVREINADGFNVTEILKEILALVNDDSMVAIGAYVWAEDDIQYLMSGLRRRGYKGKIVLGGPQISYMSDGLEATYPHADIFVRGYGELALAGLALNHDEEIRGVHRAGEEDFAEQTEVDLPMMPSPWLTNVIDLKTQNFVRWESQRGCPFKCGFCQHKEPGARLKKREFAPERINKEIDLLCELGVGDIAVLDPIFNASSQSLAILRRFIANAYTGKLSLQCRAEMIDDEFLDAVEQLNVRLEFGLQTIHRIEGKAVSRNNNIDKVDTVLKEVTKRGINYEITLIYGLPEQSLESFKHTVSWCLKHNVPTIKAFPLMLLRGTDVANRKHEWDLTESSGPMPVVLSSNTFTFNDWLAMARLSEALKKTEDHHPSSIEELEHIAATCEVDATRYSPKPAKEIQFRSLSMPSQTAIDGALVTAYADRISRMCSIFG
jgi:radical SAM superfamily enzyme YgiQ (UPF0313 family)